jgi:hypothetical protein
MKSKLLILLFAFVSIYIVCNRQEYKTNIYCFDASGYYRYLPSIFIYHDLGRMQFRKNGPDSGFNYDDDAIFLPDQKETGRKTDKYPVGTSLFELPGFFAAYLYCSLGHWYPNDGFSAPYQWAGILSSILWVVLGLFVLRKFLREYYNEQVTCIVLVCIAFGTNLYCYTAFSQGMSHGYTFFLFCAILQQTVLWYKSGKAAHLYLLGLLVGLVVITRPTNMVILLVPLLWGVYSLQTLKERMKLFRVRPGSLAIVFFIFFAVAFIQMAYWKYTSGHWIFYSYGREKFDFAHPNIWKGLFSYRKGWFIYTPIAFISMLGFFSLWRKDKKTIPALLLYFMFTVYIVFSWKNWWYGGSFGCRPLIESLALLAMPLGALIQQVLSKKQLVLSVFISVVLIYCIALNIFQSYQYSLAVLHPDRMSRSSYLYIFGKTKITDYAAYENSLLDEREYWIINNTLFD